MPEERAPEKGLLKIKYIFTICGPKVQIFANTNAHKITQSIGPYKCRNKRCRCLHVQKIDMHKVRAPGSMEEGWHLGLEEAQATCAWRRPSKVCSMGLFDIPNLFVKILDIYW